MEYAVGALAVALFVPAVYLDPAYENGSEALDAAAVWTLAACFLLAWPALVVSLVQRAWLMSTIAAVPALLGVLFLGFGSIE